MKITFLILVILPVSLICQVADNFSDGNFTQAPVWSGDTSDFRISASTAVPENQRPALQLDADAAGQSCLSVGYPLEGDLEWNFWMKLSMNTSSGNFARVYLLADKDSLKTPLNGYFIQTGGADDSVDFFRQDGDVLVLLARLQKLFTGNSTNALRLKVTRSEQGLWQFSGNPAGTHALEPVGEAIDETWPSGNFAGIFFQYTGSNTTKFYFDDFYAGPMVIDTIPPVLNVITALNPSEISLVFNEAVEQDNAESEDNYLVGDGIGHPYSAIRMLEAEEVRLFFDEELANGKAYQISVVNMTDRAGNVAEEIIREVSFYKASPYDIIFTEIMADPSPPAGLPEFEYLEIYNRCETAINLAGWRVKIASEELALPAIVMDPGDYFILCDVDAAGPLQPFGRAIGLSSFGLANSGNALQLLDPAGTGICFVDYGPSWYNDPVSAEGGHSLEMTDLSNPCLGPVNWKESGHPDGGTPGSENYNLAPVDSELQIDYICCVNETMLEVAFSESLDSLAATDISNYSIFPEGFAIISVTPIAPAFDHVRIQLDRPGMAGPFYELQAVPALKNCLGIPREDPISGEFGWPEECGTFDIVVNEILFNPLADGADYVELYNRSEKALLLNELKLASVRETPPNPPDTQYAAVTPDCRSILPGKYLVLTKDPAMVMRQYNAPDPGAFLEMTYFPYFNNDEGKVLLMAGRQVIDSFTYTEEMHFLMLASTEGVSLERISTDRLGDDPGNWHSAAETAGFGTPGYQNSQYLASLADGSVLSVSPVTFSPDGDGRDDQLGISYQFGEPGKLITVLIFSSEGRLTRTLVNNEMPGTSGIYSWDGTMDDRTPAMEGIYIVYMESLGMDGRTNHYRKACVLARR